MMPYIFVQGVFGIWGPLRALDVHSWWENVICVKADDVPIQSRQFIATFPAGWSPLKVVNSKGILPKMTWIQVKDLFHKLPRFNSIQIWWLLTVMLGVYFTGGRKLLNLLRLKHILPGKDRWRSEIATLGAAISMDPFTSGGTSCRKKPTKNWRSELQQNHPISIGNASSCIFHTSIF